MNIPAKPGAIDVEIHGNYVDGREIEAGRSHARRSQSRHRDVIARIPNSTSEDIDAHEERACGVRKQGMGRHGYRAGRGWSTSSPTRSRPIWNRCIAGDPQQRPAAERNPRAAVAAAGLLPLFAAWRWRGAIP